MEVDVDNVGHIIQQVPCSHMHSAPTDRTVHDGSRGTRGLSLASRNPEGTTIYCVMTDEKEIPGEATPAAATTPPSRRHHPCECNCHRPLPRPLSMHAASATDTAFATAATTTAAAAADELCRHRDHHCCGHGRLGPPPRAASHTHRRACTLPRGVPSHLTTFHQSVPIRPSPPGFLARGARRVPAPVADLAIASRLLPEKGKELTEGTWTSVSSTRRRRWAGS